MVTTVSGLVTVTSSILSGVGVRAKDLGVLFNPFIHKVSNHVDWNQTLSPFRTEEYDKGYLFSVRLLPLSPEEYRMCVDL